MVKVAINSPSRRTPMQARSRTRVDAILNAARELISEKGSSGLKIHELSERAGVTPSSIYQYFPGKKAILYALDDCYINETYELITTRLELISSLDEGFLSLESFIDDYYNWYKSNTAVSDIWFGMAADKSMKDRELQSSRESAAIIIERLSPFIHKIDMPTFEQSAMLLTHLAGSTIRLCVLTDEAEAALLLQTFKRMIKSMRINLVNS